MDADAIRRGRERAGLTQAQVATRIGVPVDTFRSWEHGRRNPKPDQVEALEAVFAGRATKRDELAGLREVVLRLETQVRDLAVAVVRHEAELARLAGR